MHSPLVHRREPLSGPRETHSPSVHRWEPRLGVFLGEGLGESWPPCGRAGLSRRGRKPWRHVAGYQTGRQLSQDREERVLRLAWWSEVHH